VSCTVKYLAESKLLVHVFPVRVEHYDLIE
jgi:hypothetical protein